MNISYLILGLVLAVQVKISVQWSGNFCSSVYCAGYRRELQCAYRTWNACCAYKWVYVPIWRTRYFCCNGWTTSTSQNCNVAICNPPCRNGGTCEQPNQCVCRDGSVGPTCNTLICNYERPCFPGRCTPGSSSVNCVCNSGFTSADFCRQLEQTEKPIIWDAKARMSFWMRGTGRHMEKYALYLDSTNTTEIDFIWTNRKEFNWLNVTASAQYERDTIPVPPTFIKDYKIGIAQAEVHLFFEKIPFQGSNPSNSSYISLNMTIPCSPSVSHLDPTSDTYMCNISKPNFDRSLENGDKLTITFKAWSGGYRELQQINPILQDKGTQNYTGPQSTKQMAYYFDFMKPVHACLSDAQCQTDTAFRITEDITKNALNLRWSGWRDVPSGMHRYAWEVFRLQADGNHVLKEPDPLGPIYGPIEVNQTSSSTNSFTATYTPTQPGVYSCILESSDKANNSIFVRRIAIFDPSSSVTTDTAVDRRLFISSANPNGNYNWQQNETQALDVTWTNHFANLVHEEGEWLTNVKPYPPQLEDFLKNIPSNQDDHEGMRTIDEIPNKRGIVKFEIAKAKDSDGGQGQTIPTTGWTDVYLNETVTIDTERWLVTGSDTVTVWVKAIDAMGNTRVDSTKVSFDGSPPKVDATLTFQKDKRSFGVPFSSTVKLGVLDMQSGLKRVDFTVFKSGTTERVNNFTIPFPSIPLSICNGRPTAGTCYCPKPLTPECYDKTQTLAISNCKLFTKKDTRTSESIDIRLDFMNMAGLVTTRNITVNNVASLNGTESYLGPLNTVVTDVAETSATVRWRHAPSCYNRTEMWISYRKGGKPIMEKLHHSATSYNLADLEPGTAYVIELISQYGKIKSHPVPVSLTTKSYGLSGGAIAGIVIGMLLLLVLILVIVGLILFKLGMLAGVLNRRDKYKEPRHVEAPTEVKQNNRVSRWAFDNTTYTKDEEIYIYGSMDLGEPWYVRPDDLILMEEIATGKFAKIYKAKWKETPKNVKEVAAKVLKDRTSEDDIMLMMAKINFASTQVGEHRNILLLLGAVMDNDALGPVMVTEYCETGQLDKWLVKKRSNVSEDILDRIQTFALEIARAMEYLATKGVVHRKLAARNCLLTFLLEIKVTGFGPCKSDESDDGKGDRIPIKWTAPECFKSLKHSNEKSDAWSYGVTIWEIFSLGGSPYSDVRGRDLPTKVKGGYRMPRPEYAEDIHYTIMQECWANSPSQRPDFRDIVATLENSFGLRPDGGDQNYYYQR